MAKARQRGPRYRHLYAVAMVSALSILIISVITYVVLRGNLVRKRVEHSTDSLTSIMKLQDSVLEQVERTLNTLTVDPDIAYFSQYRSDRQYVKMVNAFQRITRICFENDFVERIAVLYIDEQRVLSTDWGVSDLSDFLYAHEDIFSVHTPSRGTVLRTSPVTQARSTGGMELLQYLPLNYLARPKAVLAVRVSNAYYQFLDNLIGSTGGDFFLTDASRQLLYGTLAAVPAEVEAALHGPTDGNGVYYTIENNHLITRIASPTYALSYTFRIPMEAIIADVDFIMYLILGVTALVILMGSFGATAIVRRWYKPLDTLLVERAGENPARDVRLAPKEAAQKIHNLYEENKALLSQSAEMQALFEQHRRAQKKQFLREILSAEEAVLPANLKDHGIGWREEDVFCVLLFSIDDYTQYRGTLSAMDRSMFGFHLMEKASQTFTMAESCETVELDGRETACILSFRQQEAEFSKRLSETAADLNAQIVARTGLSITIGLSDCVQGIASIPGAYRNAQKARDQRWISGFGLTFLYQPGNEKAQGPTYPYALEKEILLALKSNRAQEAFGLLEQFFRIIMETSGMNADMVQHCVLQLLSATYRCLWESFSPYIATIPPEKGMYVDFLALPTAEASYSKLQSFYAFLFDQLRPAHEERNTLLVKQVQAYIETNFAQEITLEMLAEMFSLSASHLRKIFKEHAGVSIKTYMDTVRVAKARELLILTDRSVADIAAMVGYVSMQTFLRLFKKECGITPGEFRRTQALARDRGATQA